MKIGKLLFVSSLKAKNILYISLDDPEITLNIKKSLFIDLFELYQEIISRELKEEKLYIFIDEIQYYDGWEMWLKKYFDKFPNRLSQNNNFYEK
ncbi:hypothetical protein C5S42_02590 [Candidatus Methanomarinus sp.]|nr:hypothetical protein C5S42_02590 [ANME-2 cluster archaeon]